MSTSSSEAPQLFKSSIVIWSKFDPSSVELSFLAREAEVGEAICTVSRMGTGDPTIDVSFRDAREFFDYDPEAVVAPGYNLCTYSVAEIIGALADVEENGFGENVDADDIVRAAATAYLAFAL